MENWRKSRILLSDYFKSVLKFVSDFKAKIGNDKTHILKNKKGSGLIKTDKYPFFFKSTVFRVCVCVRERERFLFYLAVE